jgi:hypothetical protein
MIGIQHAQVGDLVRHQMLWPLRLTEYARVLVMRTVSRRSIMTPDNTDRQGCRVAAAISDCDAVLQSIRIASNLIAESVLEDRQV